jgi:DNA-binding NarL/FixJ family response regulator
MTRLVIVEDHTAIAQGLALLLGGPGISVVGTASDVETAHRLISDQEPDVVLCDVMLGGRDGGFTLLERHGSRIRFLLFTAYDFPSHHARAIDGGAAGFLPKTVDAAVIAQALHEVAAGGTWFPAAVVDSARSAPRPPTQREHQLLVLLAEGAQNDAMARDLGVRVKTIEGMIRRMFDRYGVDNRTQLARFAMRQGWLTGTGVRGDGGPTVAEEPGLG